MKGKLDPLGRIVVPAQFRHELGIELGRLMPAGEDPELNNEVEILCDGSQVTIRPLRSLCIICGDPADDTVMDKGICDRCAKLVRDL